VKMEEKVFFATLARRRQHSTVGVGIGIAKYEILQPTQSQNSQAGLPLDSLLYFTFDRYSVHYFSIIF